MSDTFDKPSLEPVAATTDNGEQQPPVAEKLASNDAPVTVFRPRRRAAVRFETPPLLQAEGTDAASSQAELVQPPTTESATPPLTPTATLTPTPASAVEESSDQAAATVASAAASIVTDDLPAPAAIIPDLSRPADLPKLAEQPARPTSFVPSSVATAPVLSVQLSDDGSSQEVSAARPTPQKTVKISSAEPAPAPESEPKSEEKPEAKVEAKVEVPPAEKVPDFQEWLRQRQEALRKAREAAKKERPDALNLKPAAGVPSPDEDENRHEPSLAMPTGAGAFQDRSADTSPPTQTSATATTTTASASASTPPAAPASEEGVGFNPNRTGRRGAVFNIPPPTTAIAGEPSEPVTGQPSPSPLDSPGSRSSSSAAGNPGGARASSPSSQSAEPFILNEEGLGSAEAVEKVLASTELAETPALKALKRFLEQGKPAPIVVEKPNPVKKIKEAITLQRLGRLISKPLSWAVSSAILLGGWTLVVVGFVVFFLSLNPVPFTDAMGRVFWLFQANHASHWAALPRYYDAGVVIPWFLVFVLTAAAFVWITTGLALVFRLRKPVSAYLERTLDRRWYQLKALFHKSTDPEDALLHTSINDIESMLAQARKEAEDAVKKRKVAAAGGTPGGSQSNSISMGGAESSAMAQAAASRGSGGNG
jgi:hypothetical protein